MENELEEGEAVAIADKLEEDRAVAGKLYEDVAMAMVSRCGAGPEANVLT